MSEANSNYEWLKTIHPFEDEKLGIAYFGNLVESNFKKGWEKHNGA